MLLLKKWLNLLQEKHQIQKSRCFKLNDKSQTTFLKLHRKYQENENWCKHSLLKNDFFLLRNNQNLMIHCSTRKKLSLKLLQCMKMKKKKKMRYPQLLSRKFDEKKEQMNWRKLIKQIKLLKQLETNWLIFLIEYQL